MRARRRLRLRLAVPLAIGTLGLMGCAAKPRPRLSLAREEPGSVHFRNYCAACHQYDGQGMGSAPPLSGSPWVKGPEDRLIRLALHGVSGPMEVGGKIYDQEMPGFGEVLTDADMAALLTFVRSRFGDGSPPVTEAAVRRVRAREQGRTQYWRVSELLEQR